MDKRAQYLGQRSIQYPDSQRIAHTAHNLIRGATQTSVNTRSTNSFIADDAFNLKLAGQSLEPAGHVHRIPKHSKF